MAWFKKYRKYRKYRKYGSSLARRSKWNSIAGLTNKDSTQVNISVTWPAKMTLPAETYEAAVPIGAWVALTNSSFYNAYSQMYDQVKIDYVRVKINGAVQGNNTNSFITPTVVSAWDRNGLLSTQLNAETGILLHPDDVRSYGSAISKPWSLGNSFVMTRKIAPSTMQEKSTYIASTSVITAPLTNEALPFNPTLLLDIMIPSGTTFVQTLQFSLEFDIVCTFRGIRKSTLA